MAQIRDPESFGCELEPPDRAEQVWRSTFDSTNDAICLLDVDQYILQCNRSMAELFGKPPVEINGRRCCEVIHNTAEPIPGCPVTRMKKTMRRESMELRINGRWLEITVDPILDENNKLTGIVHVARDFTERKNMEIRLRQSEERFRTVFEQASIGIAMSDREFRFFRVNAAFCAMFGYSAEELSAMTFKDITHPAYLSADIENVARLTRREIPFYKTIKQYIKKNGDELWAEITLSILRNEKGEFLHSLVLVEDITARKRAEEEMQRAARLESLKMFAGGIAHDFNNLLGGIFGHIDLARSELPTKHKAAEYLDKSFPAFERAKHLARQLLTFAKGGAPIRKPVRLPDLIRDTCALSLSGSNVKCKHRFADQLWAVEGDENQLAQVFGNLMINASQAMPEGGVVTVVAENRTIEAGRIGKLSAGRYVTVTVWDQGIGIPEKLLDKIFDPFFTTKLRGSGLGLATSHSIITRHGGHIEVASKQGEGSAFTIWLPASVSQDLSEDLKESVADLCGSGRILVMDDERIIREVINHILTGAGYEVVLTAEGKETVEEYGKAMRTKKAFRAVILDLTVPDGMGGEKTLRELKKLDPDVVAIVSSGYSDDDLLANYSAHGFAAMVSKPYRSSELLLTVKHALGSKS
jgi:PAS domain S-box-containing protein